MGLFKKLKKQTKQFFKYPFLPGGGVLEDFLDPGTRTVTQDPLLLPEQIEAMGRVSEFGKTGTWGSGKYRVGTPYAGSFGQFTPTGVEKAATGRLSDMLAAGGPELSPLYGAGESTLMSFLGTDEFDPFSEKGQYRGFRKQAFRELEEGQERLKARRAYGGSLFNQAALREQRELEERTQDVLQSRLADLYDTFVQRRLGAAQFAPQLALQKQQQEQALGLERIGAGFQYGGLERQLADVEAQRRYQDFLRTRQEEFLPLETSLSLARLQVPFGIRSMQVPKESPWDDILGIAAKFGGSYLGAGGAG